MDETASSRKSHRRPMITIVAGGAERKKEMDGRIDGNRIDLQWKKEIMR